jgi:hypothetical protein
MPIPDDILKQLLGGWRSAQGATGAGSDPVPPLSPDALAAAKQAARQALAPKQRDESHLLLRQFGPDGSVLQHSEEWTTSLAGLKAETHEVRIITSTGELAEPKKICVLCLVCGGHDCVVNHCRCGVALCRRCLRYDPVDNSPRCPQCYQRAVESFNTWEAEDRQNSKPKGSP